MKFVVAISLLELNARIAGVINRNPALTDVWVRGEVSDFRYQRHCYFTLVEKDDSGRRVAEMRVTLWAGVAAPVLRKFEAATGTRVANNIKVLVHGTVQYSPQYGLSLNIDDIDPTYTMGDLLRRRAEIAARLRREGIIDANRQVEWPVPALRVAVISARQAAGYGDFIKQLLLNPRGIRYTTRLFEALMQGDRAVPTIIAALEAVAAEQDRWDCVVIIRGGGSSSDLLCFESYDLAANIAMFPLPVIVGIGHDRDTTVLDLVANTVVKTPTAAAEAIVARAVKILDWIDLKARDLHAVVLQAVGAEREHLSYCAARLPVLPGAATAAAEARLKERLMEIAAAAQTPVTRGLARLDDTAGRLPQLTAATLRTAAERLDTRVQQLGQLAATPLHTAAERLDAREQLLCVLSPQATLERGYSITRVDGRAVTDPAAVPAGAVVETLLARGILTSTANPS